MKITLNNFTRFKYFDPVRIILINRFIRFRKKKFTQFYEVWEVLRRLEASSWTVGAMQTNANTLRRVAAGSMALWIVASPIVVDVIIIIVVAAVVIRMPFHYFFNASRCEASAHFSTKPQDEDSLLKTFFWRLESSPLDVLRLDTVWPIAPLTTLFYALFIFWTKKEGKVLMRAHPSRAQYESTS